MAALDLWYKTYSSITLNFAKKEKGETGKFHFNNTTISTMGNFSTIEPVIYCIQIAFTDTGI